MTARMPQKQRELFQRIEQQHSVQHEQEDTTTEGALDDTPTNSNNVNWYSSDEDGETYSAGKMQGQGLVRNSGCLLFTSKLQNCLIIILEDM